MSVQKAAEKGNLLNFRAESVKSAYHRYNSNSTSGSFDNYLNENRSNSNSNSNILNSETKNKKQKKNDDDNNNKANRKCKHNYKLLAKFYNGKNKTMLHKKFSDNNNSNKDTKKALKCDRVSLTLKFENKENSKNAEAEKPFKKICFCVKCRGLIIKLKKNNNLLTSKKKLFTVANLASEVIKSYINPIELFFKMQSNDTNKGLIYINNYSKKRKDMISFIAKLRNKYKLSLDSFYLTIALLDHVCAKIVKFSIDIELLTIGCFFLAGKFLENDAYLGEFELLSNNFKKIFYSVEEMQKVEVHCLNLLSFNLSIPTAKQYYDIFCVIGFIFDDELNSIKDFKEFYESGNKVLKEIISDFQSTSFSSLSIAFAVVKYSREANLLESKKPRMHILESVFSLKPNFYFHAYELLKKIKNFKPVVNNDNYDYTYNNNNNNNKSEGIKLKLNSDNLNAKNIIGNSSNNKNNFGFNNTPVIESNRSASFNYFQSNKNFCNQYFNEKINFNSDLNKENEITKGFDDPNAFQFKTSLSRIYSNSNKTYLKYNNNDLNTINSIAASSEYTSSNFNIKNKNKATRKKELPSIRSASMNKHDKKHSRYTSNEFCKEFEPKTIRNLNKNSANNNNNNNNNQICYISREKLKEKIGAESSEATVDAIVSNLYSSEKFKKTKQKFVTSTDIKVIKIINDIHDDACDVNDFDKDNGNCIKNNEDDVAAKIKKVVIKNSSSNNYNENIDYSNSNNINENTIDNSAIKKRVRFQEENLEEKKNTDRNIITKISQQLKSSTTKKLVSINPNSTFNVSLAIIPAKTIFNQSKISENEKFSTFKKPANFLATSNSSIKLLLNQNAASASLKFLNYNESESFNDNNKKEKEFAAAPQRRTGKMASENPENENDITVNKRNSKRLSHENLLKVNFAAVNAALGKSCNY